MLQFNYRCIFYSINKLVELIGTLLAKQAKTNNHISIKRIQGHNCRNTCYLFLLFISDVDRLRLTNVTRHLPVKVIVVYSQENM